MFSLPAAPQTIGQTLDTGFKLYFKTFTHVLLLSLIVNGFSIIFSIMYGQRNLETQLNVDDLPGMLALLFALVVVSMVCQIAITQRIHSATLGDMDSMSYCFSRGLRLFLPYFASSILFGLVVGLGMVLLIIPGIALLIYMFLYSIAMVTEDTGPIDSLQRSFDLVKQNWWRSMAVMSVVGVIYLILYSVAGLVLGVSLAFQEITDVTQFQFWVDVINAVIGTLLWPLLIAMSLALFNDLRLRREGGDLEARINEMM